MAKLLSILLIALFYLYLMVSSLHNHNSTVERDGCSFCLFVQDLSALGIVPKSVLIIPHAKEALFIPKECKRFYTVILLTEQSRAPPA